MLSTNTYHTPKPIGRIEVGQGAMVGCYGWCVDPQNAERVVAMHVAGPSNSVKQWRATIIKGGAISMLEGEDGYRRKYSYVTKDDRYTFTKEKPLPNSHSVSMIAQHWTLTAGVNMLKDVKFKELKSSYIPYFGDDQHLYDHLFLRIRNIITIAVLREWVPWMYKEAQGTTETRLRAAGRILQREETGDYGWSSDGFNIVWMSNQPDKWVEIIKKGLRTKALSMDHLFNKDESHGTFGV